MVKSRIDAKSYSTTIACTWYSYCIWNENMLQFLQDLSFKSIGLYDSSPVPEFSVPSRDWQYNDTIFLECK
jgi:hypothetical protein